MGTSGRTDPAPDARLILNTDDPPGVLNNRPDRADQKALRLFAMAADGEEGLSFDLSANDIRPGEIILAV